MAGSEDGPAGARQRRGPKNKPNVRQKRAGQNANNQAKIMQYHIEPYLRELLNAPSKYHDIVIDKSANAPRLVHADGSTQWKNGRPRKYTRAVNEIRVGHGWLVREFPVTWSIRRLTCGNHLFTRLSEIETADLQIIAQREYWATWLAEAERRKSEADWWMAENRRYISNSLDPEEDERLYA